MTPAAYAQIILERQGFIIWRVPKGAGLVPGQVVKDGVVHSSESAFQFVCALIVGPATFAEYEAQFPLAELLCTPEEPGFDYYKVQME